MSPLVLARSTSATARISSTSGPRAANRRVMSFGSSLSPAAARSSRLLRLGCLAKPEPQSAPSPLVGQGNCIWPISSSREQLSNPKRPNRATFESEPASRRNDGIEKFHMRFPCLEREGWGGGCFHGDDFLPPSPLARVAHEPTSPSRGALPRGRPRTRVLLIG